MSIELHIEGASDITIAGSAKVFTEENAPVAKCTYIFEILFFI